ncbi:MAG: hypothetical protein KGI29_09565 [Pseudomonadota bacterium]|nr:hypothetical protein [Pseudomonadota bacterium]MDE3038788.1 hypothetical protein [Pseudomonadota bacterium]
MTLPVAAFAAGAPVTGAHDSHAPIEVTSDALEVFQQENKAVFTGHVVAIQQDVRLKADKMTVHYSKAEETGAKPVAPATPKPDSAAPPQGAIQKIDAEGSVFLSTPEETASGAQGVYDVEHHEIHLDGDVVLTKGRNVLKGDQLTYNFDSGKSVLTGGAGTVPGEKKNRVRALFVPGSQDSKKGGK